MDVDVISLRHTCSLLDTTNFVYRIFIDLEKVFDTVNHNILCDKLNYYNLCGNIKKVMKYTENRKQYASLNGTNSHVKHVSPDVPQGSLLGPLLFLLYIQIRLTYLMSLIYR